MNGKTIVVIDLACKFRGCLIVRSIASLFMGSGAYIEE